MLALKPEERRSTPRTYLGCEAKIVFGDGTVLHYCNVTDISKGGVRLHLYSTDIPDVFALLFPGDGPAQSGNYEIVWRRGQNVGAKYIGTGPQRRPYVKQ